MKKFKKILPALLKICGSAFAMALISLAADATTRSVYPLWHEEPEMPNCLKARIN